MKIYIAVVFFVILACSSIAQSISVDYRYSLKYDQNAKVVINGNDKNLIDVEGILSTVKSSYIQYELKANNDLISFEYKNKDNSGNESILPINISNKVIASYIDRKNNKFFCEEEFFDKNIQISDSIIKNIWNITTRDTVVNGYVCKIATLEESPNNFIMAYYTDEIPIFAGPYIYNDLSGLVIKIENKRWIYEATSIKFHDNMDIVPPGMSGKNIKYAEFLALKKKRFNGN